MSSGYSIYSIGFSAFLIRHSLKSNKTTQVSLNCSLSTCIFAFVPVEQRFQRNILILFLVLNVFVTFSSNPSLLDSEAFFEIVMLQKKACVLQNVQFTIFQVLLSRRILLLLFLWILIVIYCAFQSGQRCTLDNELCEMEQKIRKSNIRNEAKLPEKVLESTLL